MKKAIKKIVFVGMSGGVDSSVSAAILKNKGFDVVGVFIKTWHPEFIACNEEDERLDAMRVCAHLDIPFLTFDFEDVYKKEVADYMISEYKKGNTPNPDVMCNRHVKFGAFYKKALSMGADYVATGHYAQNENFHLLKKGIDPSKDQSYFLWTLKQEQLSRIIFPIGNLKKTEVRVLAKKFKIPVALKKDSQGICFLGAIDLKDFLKHSIKEKKGKVLNEMNEEIGHHFGVVFVTLGERHGFTVTKKGSNDGPYYVISKDVKKNTLVVSQDKNFLGHQNLPKLGLTGFVYNLKNMNWVSGVPHNYELPNNKFVCQIRYHGEFLPCKIKKIKNNEAQIIFEKYILVDKGQSCVIYENEVLLGGGIVK